MNRLLLLLTLLLASFTSYQQPNHLFIKKGIHKKRTYSEGDRIHVVLTNGLEKKGAITLLRNDTIYINDTPIPSTQVAAVVLNEKKKKPFPADLKTMLAIGGGVALTTLGLSLNDANEPKDALIAAAVIGYGPILVKHLTSRFMFTISRKQFRMGKRFRLQVFDLYVPPQRGF
ncbi:hypothetical protein CAP36_08780 [Chitinophagaceae bacterium IBVUCB2]|nr:hypothetical protein CAP36_08780 [Chitinophagaceae bacterium IBVUCB2]